MKPMSISQIARKTNRSATTIRDIAIRLGCQPTHSEPIGRYPRQFYNPEPILDVVAKMAPRTTHGPNRK